MYKQLQGSRFIKLVLDRLRRNHAHDASCGYFVLKGILYPEGCVCSQEVGDFLRQQGCHALFTNIDLRLIRKYIAQSFAAGCKNDIAKTGKLHVLG